MTKPKKPAGFNLANPVPLTKWEAQRIQERVTPADYVTVPLFNGTAGGRYDGKELSYRGRQ